MKGHLERRLEKIEDWRSGSRLCNLKEKAMQTLPSALPYNQLLFLLFFWLSISEAANSQTLIVASNGEHQIELVNPNNFQVFARVPSGKGPHEIAVSSDGRYAYVANTGTGPGGEPGNTITVVDLTSRSIKTTFSLGAYTLPHDLRVARDGSLLWVVCAPSKKVLEIDTRSARIRKTWNINKEGGWMLAPTPDGRKIYVANLEGGSVSVIDRPSGGTRIIPLNTGEIGIDVSPNGREVWVSNSQKDIITVIDTATDRVLASFYSGGKGAVRVKLSPDGKRALVPHTNSKTLVIFDVAQRTVISTIDLPESPKVIAISSDGKRAFLTNPSSDNVTAIDLVSTSVLGRFPVGKTPDGVAWSDAPIIGRSQVAFTIPEKDLIPEGIAYDPVTQTFFVSSTYKRKIVRIDRKGRAEDFAKEAQDGLLGVVGMKVDAKRRLLWVLSSHAGANMPMKNMVESESGRSLVCKYDLTTGQLVKKYALDNKPESHFLNDLTINVAGDVFITDSLTNAIYHVSGQTDELELFVKVGGSPNGITLSEDEKLLFVAIRGSIGVVDLKTKNVAAVELPPNESFGADGLYFWKGSLVAIQPGNGEKMIARYVLNRDMNRVDRIEPVEVVHPAFQQPTTGVIVGNSFYYIANSQLQLFRRSIKPDGSYPIERLRDVVILKARL
jgi:YVTN family beta-propeller protein